MEMILYNRIKILFNRGKREMRTLFSYCLLLVFTIFLLIVWIPLSIEGGILITEPNIFIRYMELSLLILILGFSIERCFDWVKERRKLDSTAK